MTYIKINDQQYAATIVGRFSDKEWDSRESKAITLEMSYEDAMALFVDDLDWAIVYDDGETVEFYDNSEYSVAGSVTDHRNGTVPAKLGEPTDAELLAIIMGG